MALKVKTRLRMIFFANPVEHLMSVTSLAAMMRARLGSIRGPKICQTYACQRSRRLRDTTSLTYHIPAGVASAVHVTDLMRPHRALPTFRRRLTLMCLDDCFARNIIDEDLITIRVVRVLPHRAVATLPCNAKGSDEYETKRLAAFIRANGNLRMVSTRYQVSALEALVKHAVRKVGVEAKPVEGETP